MSDITILIVDDEPTILASLSKLLTTDYRVLAANSGERALEIVEKNPKPDLILLDVLMPGIDGFEVCKQLKSNSQTENIPVVFVSAADTTEDRMHGYNAGGDDYVTKPFNEEELKKKIKVLLSYKDEMAKLAVNASDAMNVAMVAMTSASELGNVLDFLSKSFNCHSTTELAKAILSNLNNSNLHCVVQIRESKHQVNLSNNGPASPLEISVIDKLKDTSRIFDFGSRTIINYPHVSLLIKNMPLDEPELYGRIKDNIIVLVEGAEERTKAIAVEDKVKKKQDDLKNIVLMTEQALNDIDARNKENKLSSTRIMQNLLQEIEESFMGLGLTEEQEKKMVYVLNENINKSLSLYEEGLGVDEHLFTVMERLQQSISD